MVPSTLLRMEFLEEAAAFAGCWRFISDSHRCPQRPFKSVPAIQREMVDIAEKRKKVFSSCRC